MEIMTTMNWCSICTVIVISVLKQAESLSCLTCNTTEFDSDCAGNASLVSEVECPDGESFCTVMEETGIGRNLQHYRLVRSCNDTCTFEGCGIWGTEEKDYVRCRSCCQTDLCNYGSTGTTLSSLLASPVLIAFLTLNVWKNNL